MSLTQYQRKRDFSKTAEPKAAKRKSRGGNRFVVQKHDASRLHYDFRLEMDGVLKSWAVPKGFPWEKSERRLAVEVEDHPLDYAEFEGIIPEGQYGGGTVMVWDIGEYEVLGGEPLSNWRQGKLHLFLSGKKLSGEWTLVRGAKSGDERNWFLIKTGERVKPISKSSDDRSALTDRSMRQIAAQKKAVWQSSGSPSAAKKPTRANGARPRAAKASKEDSTSRKTVRGRAQPHWIEPMKAKLVERPPPGEAWDYEIKWDGIRALAIKDGRSVELISRNEKSLTSDFPEVRDAIAALPVETAVIDGEVCALDGEGRPSFRLLQKRAMGEARPPIFLYAFDLVHIDGHDLSQQPLRERKSRLEQLLSGADDALRYSASLETNVEKLLEDIRSRGMEGLIGKRRDSKYEAGKRSGAWVKIKVSGEQEFVIGGYTAPKGTRRHFGALLVGYYERKELRFASKVGAGFDHQWLQRLQRMMRPLETKQCPFVNLTKASAPSEGPPLAPAELRNCTWVRPKLVCQIKFAEWTADGSLRQPVFLGLRDDVAAKDVVGRVH